MISHIRENLLIDLEVLAGQPVETWSFDEKIRILELCKMLMDKADAREFVPTA